MDSLSTGTFSHGRRKIEKKERDMKDYSKMTLEEMLKPAPKEDLPPFPPEESEYIQIDRNPTPSGGDLSIAYFYDKEHNPCKKENAAYINVVEYKNDGTRINEFYGVM